MRWIFITAFVIAFTFPVSVKASPPRAVFQSEDYDFGDVMEGVTLQHDFILKNAGTDVLVIKNIIPT